MYRSPFRSKAIALDIAASRRGSTSAYLLVLIALLGFWPTLAPQQTARAQGAAPSRPMPGRPMSARVIPYHKPGRPAKFIDGDTQPISGLHSAVQLAAPAALADGALAPDPLAGNYRLVGMDQLVAAWGQTDPGSDGYNHIHSATFDALDRPTTLAAPHPIVGSPMTYGSTNSTDIFDLVAGDLNGDGQAEQVVAWRDVGRSNNVQLTVGETPGSLGRITAGPAAVAVNGQVELFVRGYDDALWHGSFSGASWAWDSLGGYLTSGPTAVVTGAAALTIFAQASDGAIYSRSRSGASWSEWAMVGQPNDAVPPDVMLLGNPAAVARAGGRIDLFARASDNTLRRRSFDGRAWGPWQNLGGIITSSPAVAALGDTLYVFARGVDDALWYWSINGSDQAAQGWFAAPPDASIASAPAAAANGGTVEVIVRGADGRLWRTSGAGTNWAVWQQIGASLTGDPALTAVGGQLRAFALDG